MVVADNSLSVVSLLYYQCSDLMLELSSAPCIRCQF